MQLRYIILFIKLSINKSKGSIFKYLDRDIRVNSEELIERS